MKHLAWGGVIGVFLTYCPAVVALDIVIAPDLTKINDVKVWSTYNA